MKKICLVVGDIMLDKYLYGIVSRISPEAPIPIVSIKNETEMLGGAANVAANLKGLGLRVVLCSVSGNDYEGKVLNRLMEEKDIAYKGIQGDKRTTVKTRIVGQNQQIVRIDKDDVRELNQEEEQLLIENLQIYAEQAECIIISDYRKGVCTKRVCQYLIETAHKHGGKVLVDPKQSDWSRYYNADIIKPNFGEFCAVAGKVLENTENDIILNAKGILKKYGLGNLLVTRSQYGMTMVELGGDYYSVEAIEKDVYDVSGAGDTAMAALTAGLCWGYGTKASVELANIAAGIAVSKSGTYVVGKQELLAAYQKMMGYGEIGFETSFVELTQKLQFWRQIQKKIVFTNGCFDILHRGHVEYLQKAKKLGDILIVGVNSDLSVKRLKGDLRPVNTVQDRVCLLQAMACVDEVVIFEEDTPYELLRQIQPDILVKGGDYKPEEVVGREFAREVRIMPFVNGCSTTRIIEKICLDEDKAYNRRKGQ